MVKDMFDGEKRSQSYATDCGDSLTCGGSDGDSLEAHRVQTRGEDLQANAGELQESASRTPNTVGFPRTRDAVDEGILSSAGEGGGANLVLPRSTSDPTAATSSLIASRVPLARVTRIVWTLPATELIAPGFPWQDSVRQIQFVKYPPSQPFDVLSLGECTNGPLEAGCVRWPPGLKKIYVGYNWSIDLRGACESGLGSLEALSLPGGFNQPLTGNGVGFPRGLRGIDLGNEFNQPLVGVEWPPLLRTLVFSCRFNQSLEGVKFPGGLREIRLGRSFNREISGVVWPKRLEILEFGQDFNQALVSAGAADDSPPGHTHALPAGLKTLYLENSFNHPLSGHELPDGLEVLDLGASFEFMSSVWWPSGLKDLDINCDFIGDRLIVGGFVENALPIGLPPNLEILNFGCWFNSPLTTVAFPPTLKELNLGSAFDHPIGGADEDAPLLPDRLEALQLGKSFNRSIENVRLPVGLKRFVVSRLGSSFNQGLAGVMWPPGLQELTLGTSFNQPMEGTTFPGKLCWLLLGPAFAYPLKGAGLPDGLMHLSFGENYPVSYLLELEWPRSLRRLYVGSVKFFCRKDFAKWAAQQT